MTGILLAASFWMIASVAQPVAISNLNDQNTTEGPTFMYEPPNHIDFSNETGIEVNCSARGNPEPTITWLIADGSQVTNVPRLRQVHTDGTMVLPPFRAEEFRQNIHATMYKCVATNKLGIIISRDVNIRAVISQQYDIQVYDVRVIKGNTAVFKCIIPRFVEDIVQVVSWIRNSFLEIQPSFLDEDKYLILPSGDLHIQNTGPEDDGAVFQCKTKHRLTGETRISSLTGRLTVTDTLGNVPPRIMDTKDVVRVRQGETAVLPCVTQGIPVPITTWFGKVHHEQVLPLHVGARLLQTSGALVIRDTRVTDSGAYICVANNTGGADRAETALTVTVSLSVIIQPTRVVVEVGSSVTFTCIVTGIATAVTWLKNGKPIRVDRVRQVSADTVRIDSVQPEDRGMYQCLASNGMESAQGSAELKLGDAKPMFREVFGEKTEHPGSDVTLQCVVTGSPLPQISWTLDSLSLPDDDRFSSSEVLDETGYVISTLNITEIAVEFGGLYSCEASNKMGKKKHSARVNVYGPPAVRQYLKLSAVAGEAATINCPAYGYPIQKYSWEKDGVTLPDNIRQVDFANGTLTISEVRRIYDGGKYTCVVRTDNQEARGDVEIVVLVPPKIIPFNFIDDQFYMGMRAHVTCAVSQGDLPIAFQWLKDGSEISPTLGVVARYYDQHANSLSIESVTSKHSGNYTCIASNQAGTASFTAQLLVHVPPRWTIQPKDVAVLLGRQIMLNCQADGFPKPKIKWMKAEGNSPLSHKDVQHIPNIHVLNNGSLHIKHTSEAHRGQYFCIANNGVGGALSKAVSITVNIPVSFRTKFQSISAIKGENASLVCSARGETPIVFNWTLEEEKNPRYVITESPSHNGRLSTLTILTVEREDTGAFSCSAYNAYGSDECTLELTVKESPESPTNVEITPRKNQKVFLSWTPPYDGNSAIVKYIVQYKPQTVSWNGEVLDATFNAKDASATIGNLRPATTYTFRVLAENEIGVSPPSEVVTLTTEEEAPGGPPQSVKVEALSSETLRVTWKAPREDLLYGVLRGYQVGYRARGSSDPYTFQILKIPDNTTAPSELSFNITSLRKYTTYYIVVAAYNNKGRGPTSPEAMETTAEDTPSKPPQDVRCNTLTSQTIYVTWLEPPPYAANGILLGYKVYYSPVEEWYDGKPLIKTTAVLKMTLVKLEKFTNYSIQVLSFTKVGDGVKSDPIYCKTHEDVPGPPANIRVLPASGDSVLVVWRPPIQHNGIVTKYFVYCKNVEGRDDPAKHTVPASKLEHEIRKLRRSRRYEIWVTASTSAGEGPPSRVITQSPATNKVPAAVASFDDVVVTNWKENLLLPCKTVGVPMPDRKWFIDGKIILDNPRFRVLTNGTLAIQEVQGEDEGNYTCKVENDHGHDEVKHQVIIQAPPSIASFEAVTVTPTSISVHWRIKSTGGNPILGFILHHRREQDSWDKTEISPSHNTHTLEGLSCGTKYELYLTAFSKIGIGNPTETLTVNTDGTTPVEPPKVKLIEESSVFVTLRLDSWLGQDCPILYLSVEYRVRTHHRWTVVADNVGPEQKKLVISGLLPATWYKLRITAYNSAGSTTANYDFATLTQSGGTVPPEMGSEEDIKGILFYLDLRFIFAIAASLLVILVALIIMCFCIRKGKSSGKRGKEKQIRKEDSIQSRPSSWGKPRPEGTVDSFTRLRTGSQQIGRYVAESPDELAPCATFELPTQHYRQMKTFGHRSSVPVGLPRGPASNTANTTVNLQTFVPPSRPVSDISGYRSPVANSTPSSPRRIHMIDVPTPTPNGPGIIPCGTPPIVKESEHIIRENGSLPRDGAPMMVPLIKEKIQRSVFADEGITRFSGPSFDDPSQDDTAETTFIFENPLDETDINSAVHGILVAGRDRKPSGALLLPKPYTSISSRRTQNGYK